MTTKPNRHRSRPLSHGRPPLISSDRSSSIKRNAPPSSRASRAQIRTHHTLTKQLQRAEAACDTSSAASIRAEITAHGGLAEYQRASLAGQQADRGGDSSRVLLSWLQEALNKTSSTTSHHDETSRRPQQRPLRILEVGALSTTNAITRLRVPNDAGLHIRRIDLHVDPRSNITSSSTSKRTSTSTTTSTTTASAAQQTIERADFMRIPLPSAGSVDAYDVVSLSLVLNYVPDAQARGDMLKRTTRFLRSGAWTRRTRRRLHYDDGNEEESKEDEEEDMHVFPCLFLVLPAPCVENSRYLTEAHLVAMMRALGYVLVRRKVSAKLAYYLWRWDADADGSVDADVAWPKGREFRKREINPGSKRNNFCVVLT